MGRGKEGGRQGGWLGDATGNAADPAAAVAAGSGRRAEGALGRRGSARPGPESSKASDVGSRSEAAGGGGGSSSPHCARGSCRRWLDPAAMAAAAAAAPFKPQAAAPVLLPIRRGHGNPATASVP